MSQCQARKKANQQRCEQSRGHDGRHGPVMPSIAGSYGVAPGSWSEAESWYPKMCDHGETEWHMIDGKFLPCPGPQNV